MKTFDFDPAAKFHGAYSRTSLEIRGTFNVSGPQSVGPSGVPEWVAAAFKADPAIDQIAINTEDNGRVYSRLPWRAPE